MVGRGGVLPLLGVALLLCSCAADPVSLEIRFQGSTDSFGGEITATGAAVDQGLMCPTGTWRVNGMGTIEGNPMSQEAWNDAFDAALEQRGVVRGRSSKTFTCSARGVVGSFTVEDAVEVDFSEVDPDRWRAGQVDFLVMGTWTVVDTSGDLVGATGSGITGFDAVANEMVYAGELTPG